MKYLIIIILGIAGCTSHNVIDVNKNINAVILSNDKVKQKVIYKANLFPKSYLQSKNLMMGDNIDLVNFNKDHIRYLTFQNNGDVTVASKNFVNRTSNQTFIDMDNNGVSEILATGGGYSDVGLFDNQGRNLWMFKPTKSPVSRLINGNLNGDKQDEFYALDKYFIYRLDQQGNIVWQVDNPAFWNVFSNRITYIDVFTDKKTGETSLIALADAQLHYYDINGKVTKIVDLEEDDFWKFKLIDWHGVPHMLIADFYNDFFALVNMQGKVVHKYPIGDFPAAHLDAILVKFYPEQAPYLVTFAKTRVVRGQTLISIISPENKLIYQETVYRWSGKATLTKTDNESEVLLFTKERKSIVELRME